jgi:hypothetical protein
MSPNVTMASSFAARFSSRVATRRNCFSQLLQSIDEALDLIASAVHGALLVLLGCQTPRHDVAPSPKHAPLMRNLSFQPARPSFHQAASTKSAYGPHLREPANESGQIRKRGHY